MSKCMGRNIRHNHDRSSMTRNQQTTDCKATPPSSYRLLHNITTMHNFHLPQTNLPPNPSSDLLNHIPPPRKVHPHARLPTYLPLLHPSPFHPCPPKKQKNPKKKHKLTSPPHFLPDTKNPTKRKSQHLQRSDDRAKSR